MGKKKAAKKKVRKMSEDEIVRNNAIERMYYETAVSMYRQQHDRWRQWALFFFGSIVAIFALQHQVSCYVPVFWACIAAALLSLAWIFAALCIRQQTSSWEITLREYENIFAKENEPKEHQLAISGPWKTYVGKLPYFNRKKKTTGDDSEKICTKWKDFWVTI